jgi:WD40 repeat protein
MRHFVLKGGQRPMKMVKFNMDGTLLVSCSVDETIRVYEKDGEFVGKFKAKSAVKAIDISVDSDIIVAAESVEGFAVYSIKSIYINRTEGNCENH